jgi:hypothetical protein
MAKTIRNQRNEKRRALAQYAGGKRKTNRVARKKARLTPRNGEYA